MTQAYRVPIVVADDALPVDLAGPATAKIDVEGYELHALRGMRRMLERYQEHGYDGLFDQ